MLLIIISAAVAAFLLYKLIKYIVNYEYRWYPRMSTKKLQEDYDYFKSTFYDSKFLDSPKNRVTLRNHLNAMYKELKKRGQTGGRTAIPKPEKEKK